MPVAGGQLVQAWRAEHFRDGMRYRIDVNHPAVKAVLDDAGSLGPQITAMLRIIEEQSLSRGFGWTRPNRKKHHGLASPGRPQRKWSASSM